jgi:pyruvate/2-oxoglutarate dehydrogenase complex dihydrolipoamide acyltransferase (E2) component
MERTLRPGARDNKPVTGELKDVLMPELQGADEITVGAWSKQRGDHVAEGETLMEAHTDKVNAEIPSPLSGKVDELLLSVGDPVKPGQPIARISPE